MRQTVIGLFNKSADAQEAVQRLLSNGFTNDNVDISLSTTGNTTGSTNFNLDRDDRDSDRNYNSDEHDSGISRFFKNLFGADAEASRASDIMDDAGAIDIDENANDYGYVTTGASPVGAFNDTTGTSVTP